MSHRLRIQKLRRRTDDLLDRIDAALTICDACQRPTEKSALDLYGRCYECEFGSYDTQRRHDRTVAELADSLPWPTDDGDWWEINAMHARFRAPSRVSYAPHEGGPWTDLGGVVNFDIGEPPVPDPPERPLFTPEQIARLTAPMRLQTYTYGQPTYMYTTPVVAERRNVAEPCNDDCAEVASLPPRRPWWSRLFGRRARGG